MAKVCTIGYEGASLSDFIATLKAGGVKRVVDVRELPQSRRPGFSKNVLRLALEAEAIGYEHRKELGDPKPGRDAARAGNLLEFRQIYNSHMATGAVQESIRSLLTTIEQELCVLLCYERNPQECHRKLLCDEMAKLTSLDVQHLGVRTGRAREGVDGGAQQHAGAC